MKNRYLLALSISILFLTGCSIINQEILARSRVSDQQKKKVIDLLTTFGEKNMDWAKGQWVKRDQLPFGTDNIRYYFKSSWTEYTNAQSCYKEYITIKITQDGQTTGFVVHMEDGRQEDLVKLRSGDKLKFPQAPADYVCSFWGTFDAAKDINSIKNIEEYLRSASISSVTLDGKTVTQIQLKYLGDNVSLLGIPTGTEGKITRLFYDQETGLKLKEEDVVIDEGKEGETFGYIVTIERYPEPPDDAKQMMKQADEELLFFQKVGPN